MALDDDDIKKLDKHIVEPLLEGIEGVHLRIDGLGQRIDGLGGRIDGAAGGLAARIDHLDVRMEQLGGQMVQLATESNATLAALLVSHRASAASVEAILHGFNRVIEIDRAEIQERLRALEAWRADQEKKTRH